MSKYFNAAGDATEADDLERSIWYGTCGYWTDDWSLLATNPKQNFIPYCPECSSPGFIAHAGRWYAEAKRFQDDGHPGYCDMLEAKHEKCPRTSRAVS